MITEILILFVATIETVIVTVPVMNFFLDNSSQQHSLVKHIKKSISKAMKFPIVDTIFNLRNCFRFSGKDK